MFNSLPKVPSLSKYIEGFPERAASYPDAAEQKWQCMDISEAFAAVNTFEDVWSLPDSLNI